MTAVYFGFACRAALRIRRRPQTVVSNSFGMFLTFLTINMRSPSANESTGHGPKFSPLGYCKSNSPVDASNNT